MPKTIEEKVDEWIDLNDYRKIHCPDCYSEKGVVFLNIIHEGYYITCRSCIAKEIKRTEQL